MLRLCSIKKPVTLLKADQSRKSSSSWTSAISVATSDAKMYHHGALLAAASLVVLLLQLTKTTASFDTFGYRKTSWPEYRGWDALKAEAELKASRLLGKGNNVYIQRPEGENLDLSRIGTNQDVWLYTDDNQIIYETPKRGSWHPNRVSPGWPELVGKPYKQAMETILRQVQGLTVSYGPAGFIRTQDLRSDRVWLDVGGTELVAETPKIG